MNIIFHNLKNSLNWNFFNSGQASEDPKHPKIIWPSAANCPDCRASTLITSTNGELFETDTAINFTTYIIQLDPLCRVG